MIMLSWVMMSSKLSEKSMSEYEDELFEPTEVLRFESANENGKLNAFNIQFTIYYIDYIHGCLNCSLNFCTILYTLTI